MLNSASGNSCDDCDWRSRAVSMENTHFAERLLRVTRKRAVLHCLAAIGSSALCKEAMTLCIYDITTWKPTSKNISALSVELLTLSSLVSTNMDAPVHGAAADPEEQFTKQGPAGMTVAQWADLVTIEVGPRRDTFTIPRFLARETSQVFRRRFENRRVKNMRLDDEDAWVFTMYATYMYKGYLDFNDLGWNPPQDDPTGWHTLVLIYILGMTLGDRHFLKQLSNLLDELSDISEGINDRFFGPPPDEINLLFDNLQEDHYIRRFFAGTWAAHATRARYQAVEGILHPDFSRELLRQRLLVRDREREEARRRAR